MTVSDAIKHAYFFRKRLHLKVLPAAAVHLRKLANSRKERFKGLFHIIEIVIISLVMFAVIFQIAYIPRATPDWDASHLTVQGRDLLYSMEEIGVNWADEDEVGSFVEDALNNSYVKYRVELVGAPKKDIFVGCLCDSEKYPDCTDFCGWLHAVLDDVNFNGLPVGFTVSQTPSMGASYDVIVSSQGVEDLDDADMDSYLSRDGGFVLVKDLDAQDFSDYGGMLDKYFSLGTYISEGSGDVSFDLEKLVEEPDYYRIARYFSSIPNGTDKRYNVTHVFDEFATDAVSVSGEGVKVLDASNSPACMAYSGVLNGSGRTAWISGWPTSTQLDDMGVMATALVIWSSQHRRLVAGEAMNVERASVSMYRVPEDGGQGDYMLQPMEAVLTLGYLY